MAQATRVMILGCSAATTGELTMALDWASRCQRRVELHACVPVPLTSLARWYGATVRNYPTLGIARAAERIQEGVRQVKPDIIVLADILLAYGLSPEFADGLAYLVPEALRLARVLAMDLYDFDQTAMDVDVFGRPLFQRAPWVPPRVGRLLPCPANRPEKSSPGRGRYAMMADRGPLPDAQRRAVREKHGVSGPLVVMATSHWQHALQKRRETEHVARAFPALAFRYLDEAAAVPVDVIHVGPEPLPVPADCARLRYRHVDAMPPAELLDLLGAADLFLTANSPASSAVRAASVRTPVAALHLGPELTPTSSRAGRALAEYASGGAHHPFSLWPVGMFTLVQEVLRDNPFRNTQLHLDGGRPDEAVAGIRALLAEPAVADAQRAAQEAYFRQLAQTVDTPDRALDAALEA
ncbi:MAG: hypothetical protein HY904_15410 [Deltaproteobacteria bacterium]|nr:hypothetical protein [Deltaproteobacteria bacterium]